MAKRRNRNPQFQTEVEIQYLNERGYGVGISDGKEINVLNTLPGETVEVTVFKKRRKDYFAKCDKVVKKSKERIKNKEEHFLSCSPWQIVNINYENQLKKDQIKKFYKEIAEIDTPDFDVVSDERDYGYRNKVEFAFYGHDEDDHVSLAYHTRDSGFHKIAIHNCLLLPDEVNNIAEKITEFINTNKISARDLKGLLLRYSFYEKKVIACLFVKNKDFLEKYSLNEKSFDEILKLENLAGFSLILSDFRSPAFLETEVLFQSGDKILQENISRTILSYSYNGFFQINPLVFEKAVEDMKTFVLQIPDVKNMMLADIYAGVGSIGLTLAGMANEVIGVEITPGTKYFAEKNAFENGIENFTFYEGMAEKEGLQFIEKTDILVLDPPRAGLHKKVVEKIIEHKPKYIIYLSCNPKTQAENIKDIKDFYEIKFFRAYNFYPHTPHCENLCILELKG